MSVSNKSGVFYLLKDGFIRGLGWSFGVTIGFAVISTILIFALQQAGGLPIIGNFIASLVESTLIQLGEKSPVFRN